MKEIGLYIHIPFCIKKCNYCDFTSYADKKEYIERYIDAIKKEIEINLKNNNYNIKTIYIGGGTPSAIDSKYIVKLLKAINVNKNAEITIEVNPGTITDTKLEDYKKAGINRLSIGLQSTNNVLLKELGRIHTYNDFLNTYNNARKIGFKNINVDLMIGLPNQTIEDIKNSLEKLVKIKAEHISVYSLILEENTKMNKDYIENKIKLPYEEIERNMYWYVKNTLENNDYVHYEISNFCKKGFESKHNMDCWNQKEYIGVGAAAHSYINGVRYSNTCDLEKYIANVLNNNEKETYQIIHETQSTEDKEREYMILGTRKINGISIQEFKAKFGKNPIFLFRKELSKLVEQKLLVIDGDFIKLTNKGLDLANVVWEELI